VYCVWQVVKTPTIISNNPVRIPIHFSYWTSCCPHLPSFLHHLKDWAGLAWPGLVGRATCYRLGGSDFQHLSRLALGLTPSLVLSVLGLFLRTESRGMGRRGSPTPSGVSKVGYGFSLFVSLVMRGAVIYWQSRPLHMSLFQCAGCCIILATCSSTCNMWSP
jgi:hypothetical protein